MKKIQWSTVVVLIVVIAAVWSAFLFGPALGVPEDSHKSLVAGVGVAGASVLAFMRSARGEGGAK